MRIAFSGSHRVGKSTLIEHLARRLPGHATVDEPYYLLEEEGYEHSDPPSFEDLEAQLTRSLETLEANDEPHVLFDRCPVDVVAYLLSHDDAAAFQIDDWLPRVREAMSGIELVVFVPIEARDRIAVADERAHRQAVHETLRELLVDDALGLDREVLMVEGDLRARVDQVLARVRA